MNGPEVSAVHKPSPPPGEPSAGERAIAEALGRLLGEWLAKKLRSGDLAQSLTEPELPVDPIERDSTVRTGPCERTG